MEPILTGIHHVTALCGPPVDNLRFYTRTLGLRLVKKTVNFDAPTSYHFYFGDRTGGPGTLITFFPHPGYRAGVAGASEVATTHFAVPAGSMAYWAQRLQRAGVATARQSVEGREQLAFIDPGGTRLALEEVERNLLGSDPVASDVPADRAILGIAAVTAVVQQLEPTAAFLTDTLGFRHIGGGAGGARFLPVAGNGGQRLEIVADPTAQRAVLGVGSVHHVAWRVPDDAARDRVRAAVEGNVVGLTPTRDRTYFRSIYFREPGGVVFEIATDVPGFTVDEDVASLGRELKLPPQFEPRRREIEAALPSLQDDPS